MVDALHAVHGALVPGGLVIDVRPDTHPRRLPRIEHDRRVVGHGENKPDAAADDAAANAAVATVIAEGRFRSIERGHFTFRRGFVGLAALREHVASSRRLGAYRWSGAARAQVRHWRADTFVLRRSIQWEVLRAR